MFSDCITPQPARRSSEQNVGKAARKNTGMDAATIHCKTAYEHVHVVHYVVFDVTTTTNKVWFKRENAASDSVTLVHDPYNNNVIRFRTNTVLIRKEKMHLPRSVSKTPFSALLRKMHLFSLGSKMRFLALVRKIRFSEFILN